MTETTRTAVRIPREAAALAGVAWSYLAALARGSTAAAGAASILEAFRDQYNDNRSAAVDGLVAVGGSRSSSESIAPRTLRPGGTVTPDDATAIAVAIYPLTEVGRLAGESRWGDADALFSIFSDVPSTADGLRGWFLDRLASVWPQGGANAHGRLLWWFAGRIADGASADAVFSSYVFQGRDEPEPLAAGATSIQDAAAAITSGAGSSSSAPVIPEIRITARPSNLRSPLWYAVAVAIFLSVALTSYGLWNYQRRHGGKFPWQGRKTKR